MVVKKRQVVIIALVIMILVAGYLNWSYKKDMETVPTISQDVERSVQKNLGEAKLVNSNLETNDSSMQMEDQKVVVDTGSSNIYFIESRMERERSRSEALEILQSIVDDQNSPKESKVSAQNKMIDIAKIMDKEMIIENLIKAKGFKDTVAFVNDDKVNIVVQSDGLIPSQVAQIQDIVVSQTGVAVEKIKIIELR
ncbi:MAG: stage sporulation protein [Clostridiales bacterium]|nr:stage sporulation protein [Clostridiales bacterium]MDK2934501.1 stage sporulation protein [Clostridiales bacterium]